MELYCYASHELHVRHSGELMNTLLLDIDVTEANAISLGSTLTHLSHTHPLSELRSLACVR
jgi:hypothetical protein